MNNNLEKIQNLLKDYFKVDIDVIEDIRINNRSIDIIDIISIYKTRKNLAKRKGSLILVEEFKKLIFDLELALNNNSHVKLMSLKIKNSGYILYLNENLSQILASFKGVIGDSPDGA